MKYAGYTLIELVIALAISALLLSLTIPKYDLYERQLAIKGEVQKLVGCMQTAHDMVSTPTSTSPGTPATANVMVKISYDGTNTICAVEPRDGQIDPKALNNPYIVTAAVKVCKVVVNNQSPVDNGESGSIIQYYLNIKDGGYINRFTELPSPGSFNGKDISATNGTGISPTFSVSDTATCATQPLVGVYTVTIPVTGNPIQITD